ncbi:MAG: hypothetical protein ABL921_29200 [Pirellula sp.]
MNFAPQRDWELFGSLKREQLQKKMLTYTPEQRLDEYADIFETVIELRGQTGIEFQARNLWQEKLAIRNRLVENYRRLEQFHRGNATKANAS